MSGKQPTLHDVARLAHVSHQTVSRVINDSPNVADGTRKRVLEAIDTLSYRPNRAARSLITGRSQTLQIIDFDAFYLTPLPPLILMAGLHGYQVSVSILRRPDSLDDLQHLFDELTSRLVDGFLLFAMDAQIDSLMLDTWCRGVPYVQLGANPEGKVPAVVFDQRYGMQLLMEHLFDLGHTRIAEITGRFDRYDGCIRHEVYLSMMEQKGLPSGPWLEGDFTVTGGYLQAIRLLESGAKFTALVCGNDHMALGALRAINEAGLRVPEDISVVGFDDMELTDYFGPPLTTVRQNFEVQARLGIEYLVNLIEHPEMPPQHHVIRPELVLRRSTGLAHH